MQPDMAAAGSHYRLANSHYRLAYTSIYNATKCWNLSCGRAGEFPVYTYKVNLSEKGYIILPVRET